MMIKKWSTLGITTLVLLVIAGCGDKPTAAPVNGAEPENSTVVSGAGENTSTNAPDATSTAQPTADSNPATSQPTPQPTATPVVAQEKQSQSIEVYYTDVQVMDLVSAKATINFINEEEKYVEAFKALQSSDNTEHVSLWGKIELKSLKFTDGQIEMDIHKPVEAQLGAGGEAYAVDALSKTYFQFNEVKSIEVLVDGEKVESLMGHVDLPHPMTRDNS